MIAYKLSLVLGEGLIFGLLAIGIYIAFQWLRFHDLTPDGSFVLGACAYAKAVLAGIPADSRFGHCVSCGLLGRLLHGSGQPFHKNSTCRCWSAGKFGPLLRYLVGAWKAQPVP
jgi:hypothetical protein